MENNDLKVIDKMIETGVLSLNLTLSEKLDEKQTDVLCRLFPSMSERLLLLSTVENKIIGVKYVKREKLFDFIYEEDERVRDAIANRIIQECRDDSSFINDVVEGFYKNVLYGYKEIKNHPTTAYIDEDAILNAVYIYMKVFISLYREEEFFSILKITILLEKYMDICHIEKIYNELYKTQQFIEELSINGFMALGSKCYKKVAEDGMNNIINNIKTFNDINVFIEDFNDLMDEIEENDEEDVFELSKDGLIRKYNRCLKIIIQMYPQYKRLIKCIEVASEFATSNKNNSIVTKESLIKTLISMLKNN